MQCNQKPESLQSAIKCHQRKTLFFDRSSRKKLFVFCRGKSGWVGEWRCILKSNMMDPDEWQDLLRFSMQVPHFKYTLPASPFTSKVISSHTPAYHMEIVDEYFFLLFWIIKSIFYCIFFLYQCPYIYPLHRILYSTNPFLFSLHWFFTFLMI